MKGLIVLTTLIGVALSTTLLDQCDTDECDLNINRSSGPILFKPKQNVSKVTNFTSTNTKKMLHTSVVSDGNIVMDNNNEETGKCLYFKISRTSSNGNSIFFFVCYA